MLAQRHSATLWPPGSTAAPPPHREGSLSGPPGPGSRAPMTAPEEEGRGRPGFTVSTSTTSTTSTPPRRRPATPCHPSPATPRCSVDTAAGGRGPGGSRTSTVLPPAGRPVPRPHGTLRERGRCSTTTTTTARAPPAWPSWRRRPTGTSTTTTTSTITTTTTTTPRDMAWRGDWTGMQRQSVVVLCVSCRMPEPCHSMQRLHFPWCRWSVPRSGCKGFTCSITEQVYLYIFCNYFCPSDCKCPLRYIATYLKIT